MRREFIDGKTILYIDHPTHKSNTGHTGVCYIRSSGTYRANYGRKILGYHLNLDDAIAQRKEACRRAADGTFDKWYDEILGRRRKYNRQT